MKARTRTLLVGVALAALTGASVMGAGPAHASETLTVTAATAVNGTVDLKYGDGRVETYGPLWTGQVPTGVRIPVPKSTYSSSCLELTFSIQAAMPVDQMKDVDVDFEVWSAGGVKALDGGVWGYSEWNPSGGPTQVDMLTCDPLPDGTYNLFVTTKYEVSTNGLISRYVEGKQTLPFTVARAKYVKCKKGYTTKVVAGVKCPAGWKKVRA